MSAWLGVVSADHVRRGVSLGIAQIGHGKRVGLARMHHGDWLVYYSPKTSLTDGVPLQSFTAIGQIADDDIYQVDDGSFQPFRRRVAYEPNTRDVPVSSLAGALELTGGPNWGYQLRRGLIPLSSHDLDVIRAAMVSG
jgi:EVE domain